MTMDKKRGQGLLEFALILPVLLLLFFVIIESGRVFFAYVMLQHAAREGARYAVTGQNEAPLDRVASIKMMTRQAAQALPVDPDKVDLVNGPTSPYYNDPGALIIRVWGPNGEDDAGGPGQRVTVRAVHNVPIITPLLRPIASQVRLLGQAEMINEGFGATGASHGGALPPTLPLPPTEGPSPTPSPSPTPTSTPTDTPTPTNTPTPTDTPTPVPDFLELDTPLMEGDTVITGRGEPGYWVTLRDMSAGEELGSVAVSGNGTFALNVDELIAGHTIAAVGYGQVDTALVLAGTPTPTPTPTATPTTTPTAGPTATPTEAFITLSPECGDAGLTTVTVRGFNWSFQNRNDRHVTIEWDGNSKTLPEYQPRTWETDITINIDSSGSHTVLAHTDHRHGSSAEAVFSPCPTATPTPSPTPIPEPDLIVENVATVGTAYTGYPVDFVATIRNQGTGPVNSLFWNDLFINPSNPDDLYAELGQSSDVSWAGVSSLAPGASVGITLTYSSGFTQAGSYEACVLADSLSQVAELDESNNVGCTTGTVITSTVTPTPSPTPDAGGDTGSISGATWIWVGGNWTVPQGRVEVKCWKDDTVVKTTYSEDGSYLLTEIPEGTGYRVTGEIQIDGNWYRDERVGVGVVGGQETEYVDLLLVPSY
jgi:hypothetical protein